MTERRKVVATGMGMVSALGFGVEETWAGVCSGRSGIGPITLFDAQRHSTRIAAQVGDFDGSMFLRRNALRRVDRHMVFALAAAQEAVAGACLSPRDVAPERFGCVVGTCFGGISSLETDIAVYLEKGPQRVSPYLVQRFMPDMAPAHIAAAVGARGINYSISAACASSAHAIGAAKRHIERGDADAVLCGGADAPITGSVVAGLSMLGALSQRNADPTGAMRPFDRSRDGFVLGEGAAMVVLESLEPALKRGAPILAVVAGFGASNDLASVTGPDPDGRGFSSAMRAALSDAELSASDISYVNANGTATQLNDRVEAYSLADVFGANNRDVFVSSTKPITGHMLGAAGAAEFAIATLALTRSFVPPTINHTEPDDGLSFNWCPGVGIQSDLNYVMSNSFGFGGHNATLVIKKYK